MGEDVLLHLVPLLAMPTALAADERRPFGRRVRHVVDQGRPKRADRGGHVGFRRAGGCGGWLGWLGWGRGWFGKLSPGRSCGGMFVVPAVVVAVEIFG